MISFAREFEIFEAGFAIVKRKLCCHEELTNVKLEVEYSEQLEFDCMTWKRCQVIRCLKYESRVF